MTTYYIATTGNDTTGNGSESTPWATFAKFLSSSASGDTCIVASGTYTWATATVNNRTVQAASGATVIFDGAAAAADWTFLGTVILTDLRFTNINGGGVFNLGCFKMSTSGSATVTCNRCIWYSMSVNGGGDGALWGTNDNLNVGPYSVTFNSCLFYAITKVSGSAVNPYLFGARRTTISFSLINCAFYLPDATPNNVVGFVNQYISGLVTMIIKNTIIMASGWTLPYGTASSTTCTYSCLNGMSSAPTGTGVITSDPLFVDAAAGNFNLRPTSPCLGSGTLV